MIRRALLLGALAAAGSLLVPATPALAQMHHHAMPSDSTASRRHAMPEDSMASMPMDDAMPMDHAEHMGHGGSMELEAMYGSYPMTREASGTSWQPDAARHRGLHVMRGAWMLMFHGFADLVVDDQGGPRGDEKTFSGNMVMGMAQRAAGPGRLGLRAMLSAEPATIGKNGYPLLLQTGETANGRTPLIDRQHPHDLFMELAATYSVSRGNRSLFLYGGLPGEPALGPPAFMHRFSGAAFPQAPITHHWLDSSHITFGVLTGGLVAGAWKLEASAFRGREPDENRWDIESPKLDSHSFRLSWNPSPHWALQASRGRLNSPEQLEPEIDVDRTTASVIVAADLKPGHFESTIAWGRNRNRPGPTLDAFTGEAALEIAGRHTLFARVERVEKNELFQENDPRAASVYDVGSWSGGYRFDVWRRGHVAAGIGILATIAAVPAELRGDYGKDPTSTLVFTRVTLR
ncbi:MAG TPA: hypothetical protein VL503_02105 [Candidatus Omnitrophota bacterium]|nr:hypothetical protein [Candidatus Omnitrophota bacterium]